MKTDSCHQLDYYPSNDHSDHQCMQARASRFGKLLQSMVGRTDEHAEQFKGLNRNSMMPGRIEIKTQETRNQDRSLWIEKLVKTLCEIGRFMIQYELNDQTVSIRIKLPVLGLIQIKALKRKNYIEFRMEFESTSKFWNQNERSALASNLSRELHMQIHLHFNSDSIGNVTTPDESAEQYDESIPFTIPELKETFNDPAH